ANGAVGAPNRDTVPGEREPYDHGHQRHPADPPRHHRHRAGGREAPLARPAPDARPLPRRRLRQPGAGERRAIRRVQRHPDGCLGDGLPRTARARRRRRRADLAADPAQLPGDEGCPRGRQARRLREAGRQGPGRGPRLRRAGGPPPRPGAPDRRELVLPRRPPARPLAARRGPDRSAPPRLLAPGLADGAQTRRVLLHPLAARPRLRGRPAPGCRRPPRRPVAPPLRRRRPRLRRDPGRQHHPRWAVRPQPRPPLRRRRRRRLRGLLPGAGRAGGAERAAPLRDRGGDDRRPGRRPRPPPGRHGRGVPGRGGRRRLLQRVSRLRRRRRRRGVGHRHGGAELPQHGAHAGRPRSGAAGGGGRHRPLAGSARRDRGSALAADGRGGPLRRAADDGGPRDRGGVV
ncbi:MAG: hypothetical protein AVDCRST_MAG59-3178, partial [uncultured Thermomicrobiales bacterium]